MLNERYLHPNGQMPAYEWNFSDVNPPVHAWALMRVYTLERSLRGEGDIAFLKDAFHKLLLNFTWWINRKDPDGKDLFGGGFLGLDNIGVFDRSAPLPTGGHIEQSDGTAWMAFYSLAMLQIALELALHDPTYQSMASKFFEHFLWIYNAMDPLGERGDTLWDEEDGFFYDVLRLPDGQATRLKVRSLVGLLPLAACTVLLPDHVQRLAGIHGAGKLAQRAQAAACWQYPHAQRSRSEQPASACRAGRVQAATNVGDDAGRVRVLERVWDSIHFSGSPGASLRTGCGRRRIPRRLPAGRIQQRHVWRQLQLARPDLVPHESVADSGAGHTSRFLRG